MLLCCYMKEEPPGEAHRPAAQWNTRGECRITDPEDLTEAVRWLLGTVVEFKRVGRHVELHRKEGALNSGGGETG